MDISDIYNLSGSSGGQSNSLASQGLGRQDFITLLVTQLKNQDPLEPVENTEFIAQLAQFSSLEQAEYTNQSLGVLAEYQRQSFQLMSLTEGAALIGKEVTYYEPVKETYLSGEVEGLEVVNGRVTLKVGEYAIPLELIVEVREPSVE